MKNVLKPIFISIALIAFVAISGCVGQSTDDGKMQIVATFYPLEDITHGVGGDNISVISLIPSGVEPHDYEPSPQDFVRLNKAKAFVTIGLEFEPVEVKLIDSTDGKIFVIESSKGVQLIEGEEEHEETEEDHAEDVHGVDPHIWLSPKNMIIMTNNVKQGLIELDSNNSAYYEANTNAYIKELEQLDKDFSKGLENCDKRIILVNHQAFGYLANDYNFTQIAIYGLSPEAEPSPEQLRTLIDLAREHDIKYVLYEELVDPRIAQIIAEEVGAQTLELNPAEGIKNKNDNYFKIMKRNLVTLRTAMECN